MLFENNDFYHINDTYNYDYDVNIAVFKEKNNSPRLYSAHEGFLRGNMFRDEYLPYKNYQPVEPMATTEREQLLQKIMEDDFAINDLNLYLDLNPQDQEIMAAFKHYCSEYEQDKKRYEEKYGAICLVNSQKMNFDWVSSPWPWEKGGNKNV